MFLILVRMQAVMKVVVVRRAIQMILPQSSLPVLPQVTHLLDLNLHKHYIVLQIIVSKYGAYDTHSSKWQSM